MGWWGYGLFSGDSPLDWICKVKKSLETQIDKAIETGHYDGIDGEDIPALIFFYADFLRRYDRRTGKLHQYVEWLRSYVKDLLETNKHGWKSQKQRAETVTRLADEIEALFCKENEGYKLDPSKFPKVNIAGKRVYHLTKKESLYKDIAPDYKDPPFNGILHEGLKPQRCFAGWGENRTGIYVSGSLMGALKWQFHVLSHRLVPEPAIVSFEVDDRDEVYQDLRVDFKDDYVICNEIPRERLTIFA